MIQVFCDLKPMSYKIPFCTDVSAGTGCDIRGDGCLYKSGVIPLQTTYNHCTPEDACWKAFQPQYVKFCSLVEHSFATKTYGNCKNMFLFNIIAGLTLK